MPAKDPSRLDRVVAQARRERDRREKGYRERALKLLPWVCARCGREFGPDTVGELTVHHRDHDHDHNPADGSNWELLCRYCHDDEHARSVATGHMAEPDAAPPATHRPFAGLDALLKRHGDDDREP